jgi:hypothetical protein
MLKFLQISYLFHSKCLIISSQVLEEFHNKGKCQDEAMSIGGRVNTTIFGGCTTNIPTSIGQTVNTSYCNCTCNHINVWGHHTPNDGNIIE